MYALGVTGTYLGDYFGILMDEPVTSFPFNVSNAHYVRWVYALIPWDCNLATENLRALP